MLAIVLSAQTTATPTPTPTPTNTGPGDVIPLPLPTPEILASIERDINIDRMQLFTSGAWPGFGTVGLAVPTSYRPWPPRPTRLNHWYFPISASRWATGIFLIHKDQADLISSWAFGQNHDDTNPVTLRMSSDNPDDTEADSIDFELLTVYPPIPLYLVLNDDSSSDNGMYALLLCDDRRSWWDIPCPDLNVSETSSTTWSDVISELADAIPLDSIVKDTVDPKYLLPGPALNLPGEPLPLVFDAVAWNCGQRIVIDYAGKVSTQNFKTALTALDKDISENENDRPLLAGGDLYADSY